MWWFSAKVWSHTGCLFSLISKQAYGCLFSPRTSKIMMYLWRVSDTESENMCVTSARSDVTESRQRKCHFWRSDRALRILKHLNCLHELRFTAAHTVFLPHVSVHTPPLWGTTPQPQFVRHQHPVSARTKYWIWPSPLFPPPSGTPCSNVSTCEIICPCSRNSLFTECASFFYTHNLSEVYLKSVLWIKYMYVFSLFCIFLFIIVIINTVSTTDFASCFKQSHFLWITAWFVILRCEVNEWMNEWKCHSDDEMFFFLQIVWTDPLKTADSKAYSMNFIINLLYYWKQLFIFPHQRAPVNQKAWVEQWGS